MVRTDVSTLCVVGGLAVASIVACEGRETVKRRAYRGDVSSGTSDRASCGGMSIGDWCEAGKGRVSRGETRCADDGDW